jgi:hypothetical protein
MRHSGAICFCGMLVAAALGQTATASAQEHQIIRLEAGATEDTYFEINLSGNLYLSIRSPDGIGCVDLWWVRWPLGILTQPGNQCGNVRLPIPGIMDFALWSKLRARAGSEPVVIIASARESVVINFPPVSFP